jgi:hypothetical protein
MSSNKLMLSHKQQTCVYSNGVHDRIVALQLGCYDTEMKKKVNNNIACSEYQNIT